MDSSAVSTDRPLVLATDLDGTFLGGPAADRRQLYELIREHRASTRLIFVTGRSYHSVSTLMREVELPAPDGLICDVGTSVLAVDGGALDPLIENEIASRWADGHALLAEAIDSIDGLSRQLGTGPFRRSYTYDSPRVAHAAREKTLALGYDALISHGCFLDILPRGINKGWALRRLVEVMGLESGRVLAAGDTMNDWAMLTSGFAAVAVGNAEDDLLNALPEDPLIYRARASGAAGILEALSQHPALK
jgi:HAD superfamily hydrolase (TIGR01484 family)